MIDVSNSIILILKFYQGVKYKGVKYGNTIIK